MGVLSVPVILALVFIGLAIFAWRIWKDHQASSDFLIRVEPQELSLDPLNRTYGRLDHREWVSDTLAWKSDISSMKETLVELQFMLHRHEDEIQSHLQAIEMHESERSDYDLTESGSFHFNEKITHEELKTRHLKIKGKIQILKQHLDESAGPPLQTQGIVWRKQG